MRFVAESFIKREWYNGTGQLYLLYLLYSLYLVSWKEGYYGRYYKLSNKRSFSAKTGLAKLNCFKVIYYR